MRRWLKKKIIEIFRYSIINIIEETIREKERAHIKAIAILSDRQIREIQQDKQRVLLSYESVISYFLKHVSSETTTKPKKKKPSKKKK